MYEGLIRKLHDFAAGTKRDEDAEIAFEAADLIEAFDDTLRNPLYRADYWTPMSEEEPRVTGRYLVTAMGTTTSAIWDWGKGQWYALNGYPLDGVTFWMEFPTPPIVSNQ